MILLFELHHTVIYEKCGGMPWMLLYFALTGKMKEKNLTFLMDNICVCTFDDERGSKPS